MENRLVSVVIPAYNCGHLISRALNSVISQTYPHWEALVIDNHSEDNTREVIRSFDDDRIRYMTIRNNGIIACSRNLGVREARGRWLAFLDADDWWMPVKLEKSVRALERGSDFVYHDLFRAGPGKGPLPWMKVRTRQLGSPVFHDLISRGNAITNSSVVVEKSLFIDSGGLSEAPELVAIEDFEAWLRISLRSEKFRRLPGAYGFYWIGDGNTSSPTRTIAGVSSIERMYCGMAADGIDAHRPAWMSLALARANYRLGNHAEASKCIATAQHVNMPDIFDIGILVRLLLLKFTCARKAG